MVRAPSKMKRVSRLRDKVDCPPSRGYSSLTVLKTMFMMQISSSVRAQAISS
jgi:hypothetical protein